MMTDDWFCGDDRVPASSLLTFFSLRKTGGRVGHWQFIVYTYPTVDMYTKVSEAAAPGQPAQIILHTLTHTPREDAGEFYPCVHRQILCFLGYLVAR